MSVGSFARTLLKRSMRNYINETSVDYRDSYGNLESHKHLVWTASPEGEIIPVDESWREFTGLETSAGWHELVHPDEIDEVNAKWYSSLQTGEDFDVVHRMRHRNGEYFWMHARGFPFKDSKDRIVYWYGTTEIVHARIMAQQEREMIYTEVDHRSKNLLQIVRGLIRLAPSDGSVKDFISSLDERISSLASAYTLLADSHWQSVDCRELLERELAPFIDRVVINGKPNCKLLHPITQPFSMVVHELATNAVKYGALSEPDGRLVITLETLGADLKVHWQELGGPVATAPNKKGFGSKLIERNRSYIETDYQWLDSGLVVTMFCKNAICETAS